MVPFALTAGLSSLGSSKLVYQGGFAELIAGAISMGIGCVPIGSFSAHDPDLTRHRGYLSAKSEQDIFRHRLAAISDRLDVACAPEIAREVHDVLGAFGVQPGVSRLVAENLEVAQREEAAKEDVAIRPDERSHHVSALAFLGTPTPLSYLARRRKAATRGTSAFLIQLGEGMEEVTTLRLFVSAFTIGLSYFLGGLIPIIPYFCVPDALHGLYWSIVSRSLIRCHS